MRKPRTYSGLEEMMYESWKFYRRALWDNQAVYVEIWIEKVALTGVLYPITSEYDVPLMPVSGYASLGFLHSAAEYINEVAKPTYIYYLGDYDPSGLDIARKVEMDLREFAEYSLLYFERLAVTEQQIRELNLPTRPTKRSDSRSKNFSGESVELDAIPSRVLQNLVRNSIEKHIDREALAQTRMSERVEKESLKKYAVISATKGSIEPA